MIRSTVADVDLGAIAHNLRQIRELLEREARAAAPGDVPPRAPGIIAVVKANAYGHGAGAVGRTLAQAGATMLACADIEEGIALRREGVEADILVFGALGISDVSGLFDYRLTPTISTPSAGRALQQAAAARGVRLRYHLKIDTGMNRLGFRHDNLANTLPELLAAPNLEIAGLYTHFATADDPEHALMEEQRRRFERVRGELASRGVRPAVVHAANSAALLRDSRVWYDLVRPGLLLYGVVPPPLASTLDLRPALSLRSRLVAVKHIRAGEIVSYGARYVAERPTRIAVVPAGYADGIDTRLAGRGVALVRGRRAPIVGSICMDMLMLDITDIEAYPGDEVVLIGRQGEERIDVREVASGIGTIPWEVLCRLGSRIERVYSNRTGV
ncbi:MAG TPA: alanine racemase [Vicinamibacterales bacterium]